MCQGIINRHDEIRAPQVFIKQRNTLNLVRPSVPLIPIKSFSHPVGEELRARGVAQRLVVRVQVDLDGSLELGRRARVQLGSQHHLFLVEQAELQKY